MGTRAVTKWLRRGALAALTLAAATALTGPRPAGAGEDPVKYVALGDSYTSGPLVLPHDTRWVPQDCGQSLRNYPHLAALQLGLLDGFKDVSCGAANIDDFTRSQNATLGSPVPPQFDSLDASVDVVTVGIGGNDVGYVGLALDCMRFQQPPMGDGPCTPQYKHDGVDEVSQDIAAMGVELGAALDELHRRAPNAAVLVVSYPTALPDDAKACWPYVPILQEDMPYLVEKYKEMNATLKATAESHGASYVDIYTPSIGHDACKPPALAWVNAAVLVPPSFPAHPNDFSYLNSAPVVANAIQHALAQHADSARSAPEAPPAAPAVSGGNAAGVLPRTGGDEAPLMLAAAAVALVGLRRRARIALP